MVARSSPFQRLNDVDRTRFRGRGIDSLVISIYICAVAVSCFIAASNVFVHWFVVPVTLCGIIIGKDAVDLFRKRIDVFDPVGIIGILGCHLFFLAPLLHVHWDFWSLNAVHPSDWREWLGWMAILNFLGLLIYQSVRSIKNPRKANTNGRFIWVIQKERMIFFIVVALLISTALQAWVYMRLGGIYGYVLAYSERAGAFEGLGWVFTLSESFPVLALMGVIVLFKDKASMKSWLTICLILLAFLAIRMLFGGLRGSRSNTVWALFWAVGMIHFLVRAFPRKAILGGCVVLITFLYVYGFYKALGVDVVSIIGDSEYQLEVAQQNNRTLEATILADLSRSDLQAFLLYRVATQTGDYEYAMGRTYLGAAAILIPRSIWPDRPPHKVKEGTEAQYGAGSYVPGVFQSSRVYGLAGETILNFGPVAVPFAFILLGLAVSTTRRIMLNIDPDDARMMLLPFVINFCPLIIISDSDNLLFYLIKNGLLPFLVIWLGSEIKFVHDPMDDAKSSLNAPST